MGLDWHALRKERNNTEWWRCSGNLKGRETLDNLKPRGAGQRRRNEGPTRLGRSKGEGGGGAAAQDRAGILFSCRLILPGIIPLIKQIFRAISQNDC